MPRGSDFEARWNEGSWAEHRILEALNSEPALLAVQFGITDGTAFWSIRDMQARELPDQNQHGKRPDILIFRRDQLLESELEYAAQLLFQSDDQVEGFAQRAVLAIEGEFSPYAYKHRLQNYGKELSFTIKDEDLDPLVRWQDHFGVPLGVVQCYLDSSYFLSFETLRSGISSGTIRKQWERSYQKSVYYPPMSMGMSFAEFSDPPKISAEVILDKYGKYTAFRKIAGGKLQLSPPMRHILTPE